MTPVARAVAPPPRSAVRRTPRWWRDAAALVAWASMLIVLALWVAHGGISALDAWGSGLTSLGRLSGLVAADLLLVQVALMARVPWIERGFGQDRLAMTHRLVGFSSITLMLVHIALVTLGYAVDGHLGLLRQAWELVVDYPGMLLATAATALLLLVAVTSVRIARRRLRYESWHLLHLYAYLGVGLSIPHEVWTGADFAGRWTQLYWWTAYGLVALSVLVFRLGLPLWRSWRHAPVVEGVVSEVPGVVSVHMRGRDFDRLRVKAGQFFIFRFLSGPGWTRGHAYSLSAAPRDSVLRITAKTDGDGGRALLALRPGTRVLLEGPYGRLTDEVRSKSLVTLIAGGIGVTPLRALLADLDARPGEIVLLYRTRHAPTAVFREELARLAFERGVRVVYLDGPRHPRRKSWLPASAGSISDTAALASLVPAIRSSDVYICGPKHWTDAVRIAARDAGVPASQIHAETFVW